MKPAPSAELAPYAGEDKASASALAIALQIPVTDDDSAAKANDVIRAARDKHNQLDGIRQYQVAPAIEAQRRTNAFFKPALENLKRIQSVLRERVAVYMSAKKAQGEAVMLRSAQALQAGIIPTEVVPAPASVHGTSLVEWWEPTIADPNAVPREWCSPDFDKLALVSDTRPAIAGVEWIKKSRVTVR